VSPYSADEGRNSKGFESVFPSLESLLVGHTIARKKKSNQERFIEPYLG